MQPPTEYDKPYAGKLTIRRLETVEEMIATCPKARTKYGCAKHPPDHSSCDIYIVSDKVLKRDHGTYIFVLRHELEQIPVEFTYNLRA